MDAFDVLVRRREEDLRVRLRRAFSMGGRMSPQERLDETEAVIASARAFLERLYAHAAVVERVIEDAEEKRDEFTERRAAHK